MARCEVCGKLSSALFGRICCYCERDGHLPRWAEKRTIRVPRAFILRLSTRLVN